MAARAFLGGTRRHFGHVLFTKKTSLLPMA
jgi:hypothetical protein